MDGWDESMQDENVTDTFEMKKERLQIKKHDGIKGLHMDGFLLRTESVVTQHRTFASLYNFFLLF